MGEGHIPTAGLYELARIVKPGLSSIEVCQAPSLSPFIFFPSHLSHSSLHFSFLLPTPLQTHAHKEMRAYTNTHSRSRVRARDYIFVWLDGSVIGVGVGCGVWVWDVCIFEEADRCVSV